MSSDEEEWNGNNDDDDDDKDQEKKVKAQTNGGTSQHTVNENDGDNDDDDDMPIASLKSPKRPSRGAPAASYKDGSDIDDDDDDDDVPLVSLIANAGAKRKLESTTKDASSKKAKVTATSKTKVSSNSSAKKKTPDSKKKKSSSTTNKKSPTKKKPVSSPSTTPTTSSSNSNKSYEWVSAALYGSSCEKGLLLQRLLCRWWYAYAWPDLTKPTKPIPDLKLYDTLDGFPGVYIGTSAEVVGQLYDTRDLSTAPTFKNFVQKSSSELQQMLITAIEEQKRRLTGLVGTDQTSSTSSNQATIKELDTMLKWAKKVNTTKADKDANTVLKAHGLKL